MKLSRPTISPARATRIIASVTAASAHGRAVHTNVSVTKVNAQATAGRPLLRHLKSKTAQAKHIIEDSDALQDREKREVLAELIRMARTIHYPAVSDEKLLSTADEIFLEYDRREAGERRGLHR